MLFYGTYVCIKKNSISFYEMDGAIVLQILHSRCDFHVCTHHNVIVVGSTSDMPIGSTIDMYATCVSLADAY